MANKRAAKPAAQAPDENEIRELVQGLFTPERDDAVVQRIRRLGSRAVPALLDALRDSARCTRPYRNLHDHLGFRPSKSS